MWGTDWSTETEKGVTRKEAGELYHRGSCKIMNSISWMKKIRSKEVWLSCTKSNLGWPVSEANGLSTKKFLCLLGPELEITGMWFLILKSTWFRFSKIIPSSGYVFCVKQWQTGVKDLVAFTWYFFPDRTRKKIKEFWERISSEDKVDNYVINKSFWIQLFEFSKFLKHSQNKKNPDDYHYGAPQCQMSTLPRWTSQLIKLDSKTLIFQWGNWGTQMGLTDRTGIQIQNFVACILPTTPCCLPLAIYFK